MCIVQVAACESAAPASNDFLITCCCSHVRHSHSDHDDDYGDGDDDEDDDVYSSTYSCDTE